MTMGTDLLVKVDTILQSKNKPKTADLRYNKAATYAALSYEHTDANWAYWTIDTSYVGSCNRHTLQSASKIYKWHWGTFLEDTQIVFMPSKLRA
jgi:hypothetical protein